MMADGWGMGDEGMFGRSPQEERKKKQRTNVLCLYPYAFNVP